MALSRSVCILSLALALAACGKSDKEGELAALDAQLARGVPFWVANEDVSHPDHAGQPVAETGALLPDGEWGEESRKYLELLL